MIGAGEVHWISLTKDRGKWQTLVNMVMSLWVPQNMENFLTNSGTISFSSRTLLHVLSE